MSMLLFGTLKQGISNNSLF